MITRAHVPILCWGLLSLAYVSCRENGHWTKGKPALVDGICRASKSRENFETNGLLGFRDSFLFYMWLPIMWEIKGSVVSTVGHSTNIHAPFPLNQITWLSCTPRATALMYPIQCCADLGGCLGAHPHLRHPASAGPSAALLTPTPQTHIQLNLQGSLIS